MSSFDQSVYSIRRPRAQVGVIRVMIKYQSIDNTDGPASCNNKNHFPKHHRKTSAESIEIRDSATKSISGGNGWGMGGKWEYKEKC